MKKFLLLPLAAVILFTAVGFTACAEEEEVKTPEGCQHLSHNPDTLVCDECGEFVVHNYIDGVCTMCGATTPFLETFVSKTDLVNPCSEQGTVVRAEYQTHAYSFEDYYDTEGLFLTKAMNIYLPYGYDDADTETKYNVLILMHGGGADENFWFAQGDYNGEDTSNTLPLLDNMIQQGLAKKTIVVTPTFSCYYEQEGYKTYDEIYNETNVYFTSNFYQELQNEILPYLAENFHTYAASGSAEDLIAARDHFGYAGLSMGSSTGYLSGWRYCLPYFSYFGHYSTGATVDGVLTEEAVNEIIDKVNGEYSEYPIHYWFNQGGSKDDRTASQIETMRLILAGTGDTFRIGSDFENGDNCDYIWCVGARHEYNCWLTGLYNSLLVFFKV